MPVVDYRELLSRHIEGSSRPAGGIRTDVIAAIEARRRFLGLDESPEANAARYELHLFGLTSRYIEGDSRERKVIVKEATAYRRVQELVVNVLHKAGGHSRRTTSSGLEATAQALAESLLAAEAANHLLRQHRGEIAEQASAHLLAVGEAGAPATATVIQQHQREVDPVDPAQAALRSSLRAEQRLYVVVDRLTRHVDVSSQELGHTL